MKKLILPSLLLILFVFQTSPVVAQNNTSVRERVKTQIEERLKQAREKLASKAALRKEKLETAKLRICEARKSGIVRRSTRLAERAERQLNNFGSKLDRVENFYNNTLLPKGVVIENYDDLIADVEAKKQAVAEAINSAKTSAQNFNCSGDDPKGQLTNYRTDMENAVKALKDYRTSIKNLIVAVRTAVAKIATGSAN